MLSVPLPSQSGAWTSLQIISSNMSSTHLTLGWPDFLIFMFLWKKSTHCQDVRQSQMPSQAMITNLSSEVRATFLISGTHVIIWASTGNFLLSLYSRSPKALESDKMPRTRPSSTKPPAASMRLSSPVLSGLWSSDISKAWFPLAITQRLSPELAQIIWSLVISATQAVHPA